MATLSSTVILQMTIESLKVQFPILFGPNGFATDFSDERARKGDHVIAHIATNPSVQDYDATNGYMANGAEASALLQDLDMTMDQHKHVPVKCDHIDQCSSQKDLLQGVIDRQAFVLGKYIVDAAAAKILEANFTYSKTESIANTSKDTLDAVTAAMNGYGAPPFGRFGITNSLFYGKLEEDARIASGDYHGQMRKANAYGRLQNVAGFRDIYEYPDLPTTENLSAFFASPEAIAVATRLPKDNVALGQSMGVPVIAAVDTYRDPGSGLTLMLVKFFQQGTLDLWQTVTCLYGIAAGCNGGTDGTGTDKCGYRVKTA